MQKCRKNVFICFLFFRFPKGGQTSDPGRESFCRKIKCKKMFLYFISFHTLFILLYFLLMRLSINNLIHRFTFDQVLNRTLGEAAPCRPSAGTSYNVVTIKYVFLPTFPVISSSEFSDTQVIVPPSCRNSSNCGAPSLSLLVSKRR